MIYLATVYTSHPQGLEVAYQEACLLTAAFMRRGMPVFSPIAYGHPLVSQIGNTGHDFWMRLDLQFLDVATALWVAMQPKWDVSRGIAMEIEHAKRRGIPVMHFAPDPILRDEGATDERT